MTDKELIRFRKNAQIEILFAVQEQLCIEELPPKGKQALDKIIKELQNEEGRIKEKRT